MRTVAMLSLSMCLALAACGGPETSDPAVGGPEVASTGADTEPSGTADDCVPWDRCEPERSLFCQSASGNCYLRYPDQHTVTVRCSARPPGDSHACP